MPEHREPAQAVTVEDPRAADSLSNGVRVADGDSQSETIERFHAFRYLNFRLLWLGSAFTSAAMWIQQTTMGWVVYDLTGSGSVLGGMNAMRSIPTLLVTPFAGITADRISRNAIIGVSQVALAMMTALLALAIATGRLEVWHLFAFTLLAGVANAFNMPARQTLVFDVVPRNVVPNAVALNNLAMSSSRMAGPLLGGVLIAAFGAALNFGLQAVAYMGVMTTVVLIKLPRKNLQARSGSLFKDLGEGYSFIIKTPQARLLMLMMVINPVFLIPLHLALLPIFAKDIFGSGASGLGIMLGALGGGGMIGGLITASLNSVDRRGLMQLAGLFIHSACHACFAIVGYATGSLWLALPFLVIAGAAEALHMTTNQTVLQLLAPDHLRGRISSTLQFSPILMSLSIFVAGVCADFLGAPTVGIALSLMGFGMTLLIFIFSPRMRQLRLSRLGVEQEAATAG